MCFNWKTASAEDELTIEEVQRVALGFRNLIQLTLSGGEPTLREDLPKIVEAFCQNRPVPRITITTNGQNPKRIERMTREICRRNPNSNINIALSLDGLGEKHDRIRGISKAFDRYEESHKRIEQIKRTHPNLSLVVASVYSAFNKDHFAEILDYVDRQREPSIHGFMLVRGETRDTKAKDVNEEEFLVWLEKLRKIQRPTQSRVARAWTDVYHEKRLATHRQKRMVDSCKAGRKLLVLTHTGELLPCEMLAPIVHSGKIKYKGPLTFGNVRDVDCRPKALLKTKRAKQIQSFIQKGGCHCTFECALLSNFALNPHNYFCILGRLLSRG